MTAEINPEQTLREMIEKARQRGFDEGYSKGYSDALDAASDAITTLFTRPMLGQLAVEDDEGVEVLELSSRTCALIRRQGIHTIGDLKKMSEDDILDLHQIGVNSLEEIKSRCRAAGITLR